MARPRANAGGPPARDTVKDAQRRTLASTTAAIGGGGLAGYASNLPDPYNKLLVVFAPSISVLSAKFGPGFLDGSALFIKYVTDLVIDKVVVYRLKRFLSNQRDRLENADLPQDRREEIMSRIAQAEREIDDRAYRRITPLIGDSQAGLSARTITTNSPPPTPGDDPNG